MKTRSMKALFSLSISVVVLPALLGLTGRTAAASDKDSLLQNGAAPAAFLTIHLLQAPHVGGEVELEATRINPAVHFSWKLLEKPKRSRAKISDLDS